MIAKLRAPLIIARLVGLAGSCQHIKKFVRVNKSFIVQRALTMRQMLEFPGRMSRYMHHTIKDKNQSIWIAQREGRAKDSNDRTQEKRSQYAGYGR